MRELSATGASSGHPALGAAIRANQNGAFEPALERAAEAVAAFRASRHFAGLLRARTEEIYALHFLAKTSECASAAAEVMAQSGRYPWIAAQVRIEAAICAAMSGASGRALELLDEAAAIARGHGYSELALRASAILSEQRFRLGDPRAPWVEGDRDFKVFWKSASRPNRAHQILFNQAWAAETMGLDHAALVLRQSAGEEIARAGNRSTELSAHLLTASSAMRVRDTARARAALERAARIAPELNASSGGPRRQALLELAQASLDIGDHDAARGYLEQARALPGVSAALGKALDLHVSGRLALQAGDWAAARENLMAAREIERRRFAGRRIPAAGRILEIERLLVEVAVKQGEPAAQTLAGWDSFQAGFPVDPGASATRLDREAFLGFVESGGTIHAWFADRSGIEHRALARTAEFDSGAAQLARLCASPRYEAGEIQRVSQALSSFLLGPFSGRLRGHSRIIIAADGAVSQIPFAVLVDSGGQPLGLSKEIVRVDSLGDYLRRSSLPGPVDGGRALAVLNPALRPAVAKLYAPITVRPDLGPLGERWQTTALTGRGAHLENLESHAGDASLFLFWGHGARAGGRTALLLAPAPAAGGPEVLDAARIDPRVWRNCRLAVLAACSSGGAAHSAGSDSLVTGLLHAGVRNVIASRWDVDAQASALLIGRLLARLPAGESVSAGLREAMRAVQATPGYSHPYYWAAFENSGAN